VEFMLDLYGSFFLTEYTVIGMTWLDILELWLCCQLKEDFPGYSLFRQDGPPPDYHLDVTVASKYSNYATLSKDLLSVSKLWCCPAFWWQVTTIYFIFCVCF
jgi:hypothetical protein